MPRAGMALVTSYRVVYEPDESGMWIADARDLRGAHTQGRTIAQARARIREVIALVEDLEEEHAFDLEESFALGNGDRIIDRAVRSRAVADHLDKVAMWNTSLAAVALRKMGVSTRDAAEILGISHGRVQQLAADGVSMMLEATVASTKERAPADIQKVLAKVWPA